jgi:DNA-3-methyladenine glycosylase II
LEDLSEVINNSLNGIHQCKDLAKKSKVMAILLERNGIPPVWTREPGFESLVRIILEQAVSLESAKAVFEKFQKEIGVITPNSLLFAKDETMSRAGFSRMKWKTCRICAEKVMNGELQLFPTNQNEDDSLAKILLGLPGIGHWTVDIYFLLVLQRNDVWPVNDRALAVAVTQAFGLCEVINSSDLMNMAKPWKPNRSWAARIFWHDYLIRRNRLEV